MLFDKNKTILAALLTTFAFASAPALADDDWDDDDDDRPRATRVHKQKAAPSTVKISRDKARATAKGVYPNARVTGVDLERKRGRAYYEVELEDRRYDYTVWVDANTGAVIKKNRKRDNNDDND